MTIKGSMGSTAKRNHVSLFIRPFMEDGIHIARCDALEISDHGDTKEEAVDNLVKALGLFLSSCIARGTIDRVLKSKGIEVVSVGEDSEGSEPMYIPLFMLSDYNAGTSGSQF